MLPRSDAKVSWKSARTKVDVDATAGVVPACIGNAVSDELPLCAMFPCAIGEGLTLCDAAGSSEIGTLSNLLGS